MPIALKPGKELPIWLDCDADLPAHERPTFVFRFLTSDQYIELGEVFDRMADKSIRNALGELNKALAAVLVRVDNLPEYTGSLSAVTTPAEADELVTKLLGANRLRPDDAKNSESPSQSSMAESAAADSASPANAKTPPQ